MLAIPSSKAEESKSTPLSRKKSAYLPLLYITVQLFQTNPFTLTHPLYLFSLWFEEMVDRGPNKKNNMAQTFPNIQRWISKLGKGVSRQHLEGVAAASAIIITCFFFLYRKRKERWSARRGIHHHHHRSLTLGALHGGRRAMERILEAQHARVNASALDGAQQDLRSLLDQEPLDFIQMQSALAKLEMSGKEDNAMEMLNKALEDAKKRGDLHEAYELDMLIVELLIYQGKYIEALNRECLKHIEITDARRPLYKTVVQIMLGHRMLAQECWNEFQAIKSLFHWPDSVRNGSLHAVSRDYDEFENAVQLLKKEIEEVHKNKPGN